VSKVELSVCRREREKRKAQSKKRQGKGRERERERVGAVRIRGESASPVLRNLFGWNVEHGHYSKD